MTVSTVYAEGRERISDLLRGVSDEEAKAPVPTCPAWSVHNVVAHLTGVCADVLAGNIDGVATDPWTEAQVQARRGRPLADVLEEWSQVGPQVEAFADNFPGQVGRQWVADLTTHEHDIRAALRKPGGRDSAGVGMAAEFLIGVGLNASVSAHGLPPLEVRAGDRSWIVGSGEPVDATDEAGIRQAADERLQAALLDTDLTTPPVEPAGKVESDRFDMIRALTGRRSAAQIRRLGWSVDPEPYLPAFQYGPFTTCPTDIEE